MLNVMIYIHNNTFQMFLENLTSTIEYVSSYCSFLPMHKETKFAENVHQQKPQRLKIYIIGGEENGMWQAPKIYIRINIKIPLKIQLYLVTAWTINTWHTAITSDQCLHTSMNTNWNVLIVLIYLWFDFW